MINACFSQLYPPILAQVAQRFVPAINRLVYCDWVDDERAVVDFKSDHSSHEVSRKQTTDIRSIRSNQHFSSEQWWSEHVIPGEITELPVDSNQAYIYSFGSVPFDQYWLLLMNRSLTSAERSHLHDQGKQLHQYLELYRVNQQQAAKIKLLEHVIQRTQHQLRHPLSLIKLYAENIHQLISDYSQKEQAKTICTVVDELSHHLTDLMAYGQSETLKLEVHDLRSLLITSIEQLKPLLQEYDVEVHYPQKEAIAYIDVWKIKQVFENLLSNAIYFSPPGSHIKWEWHVFQNEILVSIEDQGSGLSETDLTHLFQPFYSNRKGGQGIGLAVARKIILDHQGHLWAENSPQGGAKFSFAIPALLSH